MTKTPFRFFHLLDAALRTSYAVQNGHRPAARDLKTLGIEQRHFDNINF